MSESAREYIFDFLDWRPVATIPVEIRIMGKSNWQEYARFYEGGLIKADDIKKKKGENENDDLGGKNENDNLDGFEKFSFRFVCRNDGIFLFQIKTAKAATGSVPMTIARDASYLIKEILGHVHVYNKEDISGLYKKIVTNPIFIETRDESLPEEQDKFEAFLKSDENLINLKARRRSLTSGIESEGERAVLTLKKLYSRVFDRSCEALNKYEETSTKFFSSYNNRKMSTPLIVVSISLYCIVTLIAALIVGMDDNVKSKLFPIIIMITSMALVSVSFYIHFKRRVRDFALSKIIILKRSIAYFSHGNNYSRIVWGLFERKVISPENDYNGVIRISQQRIESVLRQINYYYFIYGFLIAMLGLSFSVYGVISRP